MADTTATTTWIPDAPAPDAGSIARIHLGVPGRPGSHAATMTREPAPDGSQVIWIDRADQQVQLVIPPGESFAAAWLRIEAALLQASYPSDDMPASHTPEPAAARPPSA